MVESENRMDFSPNLLPNGNERDDPGGAAVPRYILYGDASERPDWFVNIEPLDKRCRERGWLIKPHTHPRMTQVVFCAAGSGTMTIEGDTAPFAPGCVMVVPPHRIHGFHYAEAANGWVITIETHYLDDLLVRAPELRRVLKEPGVFALSQDGLAEVSPTMERMANELQSARKGGAIGAEIQLMSVLLLFLRLWPSDDRAAPVLGSRADLVRRFRELVERSYRAQPLLPDLAGELGVSVSQLRLACKTVAGISPIEIVHDRLLSEAKRCLSYTPMSVTEIADWLGFSDVGYFSRFFTKLASVPPTAFRRQHGAAF
ncbi:MULTISPECIES: helix-turn-helix domain-containing protein [unclassified Novosphingobium]|nr:MULTISPECIES: helix-turn-helix domain-containing protein [unclassified Novosphingobium]MPS70468.1 helix-turn-helix domain-containing protein [Novosphingobium sp.]WRT96018.1 helix-turn-helix domain-containing protein [Novosphingobium sp. RL4]